MWLITSLIVILCLSLVACYSYLLLITLVTCNSLLVTHYLLFVTCYSLFVTRYSLLVIRIFELSLVLPAGVLGKLLSFHWLYQLFVRYNGSEFYYVIGVHNNVFFLFMKVTEELCNRLINVSNYLYISGLDDHNW